MAPCAKGLIVVIFATPDFGAGAFAALLLLLAWAATLALVAGGAVWGARLLYSKSRIVRRGGLIFLLGSLSVPLFCCLAPPCIIRIAYGNFPIGGRPQGKINEGMSSDEVAAVLGTPHERFKEQDGERWYYWCDSFGIGWFCVRFGPEGRVTGTYGS
jgi:SmpA / OmlA family